MSTPGAIWYIYGKKGCVCSYNILFSEPIAVILLLDESLLGGAPGQSWPGARRRRSEIRTPFADILVSVEAAERRSRPVQDPTANPAPADPAETRAAHPAGLPAWPRSQQRCHITQGRDHSKSAARVRHPRRGRATQNELRAPTKGRTIKIARRGMPVAVFALKDCDPGVTNIRNLSSPHWRRWLRVENRCVVRSRRFSCAGVVQV